MVKKELVKGKAGAEKIINMQCSLIELLLELKCSDLASNLVKSEEAFNRAKEENPTLLWTMPDGTVTGKVEEIAMKALDFYSGFTEDGKAFKNMYDTAIELVKYIDKITVEEL